jgi:hypothetical protein
MLIEDDQIVFFSMLSVSSVIIKRGALDNTQTRIHKQATNMKTLKETHNQ